MKELKDWEGELIRADLSVDVESGEGIERLFDHELCSVAENLWKWNPVKELKVGFWLSMNPRQEMIVESGEGIERKNQEKGYSAAADVESGEGIERLHM